MCISVHIWSHTTMNSLICLADYHYVYREQKYQCISGAENVEVILEERDRENNSSVKVLKVDFSK